MTRKVFDLHLEELHTDLLRMGSFVEKQIYECIEALVNQDIKTAEEIIKNDDIVDGMQKSIEDKAIRLTAMQQPIAADLRNIFTTVKIITDLERIADHAVDIAKAIKRLKDEKYVKPLIDIPKMGNIVKNMIKGALDAYVDENLDKAYEVCKMDDELDAIYKHVFSDLLLMMGSDSKTINQATQFLFICKYFERVGDRTTNICESTIYLITGEQVDLND
ncbi:MULTISPECIES: phosphate signaling complex protein PhoU [Clostridium]|uniref:phosphate signaling complex protein PhoU n=1 Tax=Clostridium TaxID=1485 RepID=UPI00069DD1E9|nr:MULTISPECIES: phosphate signaling complex protein PhoU [Clostridium]KOF58109.1 PhoU family transcriptional regulator [Clostridium sp. DMHC 10]MCD2346048.1 phosphate signaling complex protein PhoU [Clostridium guangxiense]